MRFTWWRWAWAQFRTDAWVSIALTVLIAVVAFTATALPRVLTSMSSDQADYQITSISTLQRNIQAIIPATLGPNFVGPDAAPQGVDVETLDGVPESWAPVYDQLDEARQAQPEPLRSAMSEPHLLLTRTPDSTSPAPPGTETRFIVPVFTVDPVVHEHARLVEGEWPASPTPLEVDLRDPDADRTGEPIPIVLMADAAAELDWSVGEDFGGALLTGIIEPLDPQDERWDYATGASSGIATTFDLNVGNTANIAAYQNPASSPQAYQPASVRGTAWFAFDPGGLAGDRLGELWAQTRSLQNDRYPIEIGALGGAETTATFDTGLGDTLEDLLLQLAAAGSVLAIVIAGPAGVVLAVLTLGARLIVTRRSGALALAHARGASPRQLRLMGATEGAITGLLGAAAGFALAVALVPGSLTVAQIVIAVLIGLLPGILLGLVTVPTSLRGQRADLGRRTGSRARWLIEIAVVALAAAATWMLLGRGVQATSADQADDTLVIPTVDPLVAATPILLTAAACVLALRLFPLPVLAIQARLRRGRHLTGFLGAARAVRDSAAGLIPGLALVVGVSVAIFSTVMVTTVLDGAESAAYREAGGDLRVNGPTISDEQAEQLLAIPGVEQVATIRPIPSSVPTGPFESATRTPGYAVEVDALRQIQAGRAGLTPLPEDLTAPADDGGLPALAAGSLTPAQVPAPGSFANVEVEWVGSLAELGGVPSTGGFVVVDRDAALEVFGSEESSRTAVLGLAPDADPEAVSAAVSELLPTGVVTSPLTELDTFRASPVVTVMIAVFVAAVLVALALCVMAVLLTQLTSARPRAQLLAVLRTIGLGRGQARSLTAWEVLPMLITSFVAGAVLGFVVPWLVLHTVDLTGLTGGVTQPALAFSWLFVGGVVGGILVFVGAAVVATAAVAGRSNIARQLRIGDST